MKFLLITFVSLISFTSCSSLNSITSIKANDSFILGNNAHGPFSVSMRNLSSSSITVYQMLPGGERINTKLIGSNESTNVKVPNNTALVIDNKTDNIASVKLKVKGDKGLSMQYKH